MHNAWKQTFAAWLYVWAVRNYGSIFDPIHSPLGTGNQPSESILRAAREEHTK